MKSLRIVAAIAATVASAVCSANSYLAWSAQDHAVFTNTHGAEHDVQVVDAYGDGWQKFSQFLGRGERWLWTRADSEVIYVYNNERRANEKLVNFADPVGKRYSVTLDSCTTSATLAEKNLNLSTAAGTFRQVIRMEFSGNCADAGLKQAWFAPEVGVVQWEEQSIIGPVVHVFTRGTVAGKPYPLPALQLIADLPRAHLVLPSDGRINAGLTLQNNSNSDLTLRFGSGQQFEISLLTLDGEVLTTWGANKRFVQGEHELVIGAGSSRYFGGELLLQSLSTEVLDVGTYLLRVELKGSHAPEASAFVPETLKVEAPLFIDRRMQAY